MKLQVTVTDSGVILPKDSNDLRLLHELEPVAERLLNRHLSMMKEWNPHDYIPWSDGKNY
ncbi:acyl-ACP desaturase, partial [Mycolicibacterium conceptionense]